MSLSPRRRVTAALAAVGLAATATTVALLTGGAPAGAAPGTPGCPAEPSYEFTIPEPSGPTASTLLADGSVGFAAIGADGKTYFVNTDASTDPLLVSPLFCLGGGAVDNPAVAMTQNGAVVFVRNAAGRLYYNDILLDTGGVSGFRQLPGIATGGPAAIGRTDGSVDLFVRGSNGALYQATRPTGSNTWTGFRSLGGGFVGTPSVAARPGGGLVVAVTNSAGLVYTKSSTPAGAWGGWVRVAGEAASGPALTAGFADGRLDLFVIGKRGGLYQNAYVSGSFRGFRRIEASVFPTTRLSATAGPGWIVVYITERYGPGRTDVTTAYTQYLPGGAGGSWTEARSGGQYAYLLAPYTCVLCAPEVSTTVERTAGKTRPAATVPRTRK